jgi:hypothetical protein
MKEIWKFPIGIADFMGISMPEQADLLHFGLQDGVPMLWALVDPRAMRLQRQFRLVGTGHPVEMSNAKYVGTVVGHEGQFVWHLFEMLP